MRREPIFGILIVVLILTYGVRGEEEGLAPPIGSHSETGQHNDTTQKEENVGNGSIVVQNRFCVSLDGQGGDLRGNRLWKSWKEATLSRKNDCIAPQWGDAVREHYYPLVPIGYDVCGNGTDRKEHVPDKHKGAPLTDASRVDSERIPEVQKITETVLEVLPESQANFALSREGAKILASNQGAKRVGALLDDDADTFMRNDCKDNKWVVIELSQVARVSQVELTQNELYSSRVKEFEVYGMQNHPRTLSNLESAIDRSPWGLMGRFQASKAKGTQTFVVESPRWVRYLLMTFVTHYGSETVCAINGLAVYGTSAAEELEAQLAEDELVLDSLGDYERPHDAHGNADEDGHGSNQLDAEDDMKRHGGNDTQQSATVLEKKGPVDKSQPQVGDLRAESNLSSIQHAENTTGNRRTVSAVNGQKHHMDGILVGDHRKLNSSPGTLVIMNASNESVNASMDGNTISNVSIVESLAAENVSWVENGSHRDPPVVSATNSFDPSDFVPVPKIKQGSVYDILIQELRATKAQQKIVSKALESMHNDLDAMVKDMTEVKKMAGMLETDDSLVAKVQLVEKYIAVVQRSMGKQSKAAMSMLGTAVGIVVMNLGVMKQSQGRLKLLLNILLVANALAGSLLVLKSASMMSSI